MKHALDRIGHFLSQVLFSIITPFLLVPRIARLRFTRAAIAFCFGRLYGNRYDDIIGAFGGSYAMPMERAIQRARELLPRDVSMIVDCGTGTGFVAKQAAEAFPSSTVIACDMLPNMLRLARENCRDIDERLLLVQADTFCLPLSDGSVDIVLAQNTMPCFHEFHRVLRPGGMVLYVDISAGWIAALARRLVRMHNLFQDVTGEKVGMGFYVLAQKAPADMARQELPGSASALSHLRCPMDKGCLESRESELVCRNGHRFAMTDGFPVLMPYKLK